MRPALRLTVLALGLLVAAPAAARRRRSVRQAVVRGRAGGARTVGGTWLFRSDGANRGHPPALPPPALDRGLEHGQGAERVERRRRLGGVDERVDRLVPEGLRAALQERRARLGDALRVGQLPLRRVAQRPRRSAPTAAPTCRSRSCSEGSTARGVNRLVVRVNSRRKPTDFPPARNHPTTGLPTGGWWNYGGILREVYLQRIEKVQVESALVHPAAAAAARARRRCGCPRGCATSRAAAGA